MSAPVVLWIRGRSPPWPGFLEGLGPGAVVDADVDPTSMRDVRASAVDVGPDAIVYAGWRDPEAADADALFRQVAEATIGVAAAAMELGAVAVLISHPAVLGGADGPGSEEAPPCPEGHLGEAFERAETFVSRAAGGRALIVRAGPVLGQGLEDEARRLASGRIRPVRGRRVTPIVDVDLGRAISALVLAGARGVVHLSGPAVDEAALWARVAAATGSPPAADAGPAPVAPASWALSGARLDELGLPPIPDWSSVLGDVPPEPSPPAGESEPEPGAVAWLWRGALPRGRTPIGPGLVVWRLGPGEAASGTVETVCVREGKIVIELGEVDQVLRAGQRWTTGGSASVQVVAVEPTEVWLIGGEQA